MNRKAGKGTWANCRISCDKWDTNDAEVGPSTWPKKQKDLEFLGQSKPHFSTTVTTSSEQGGRQDPHPHTESPESRLTASQSQDIEVQVHMHLHVLSAFDEPKGCRMTGWWRGLKGKAKRAKRNYVILKCILNMRTRLTEHYRAESQAHYCATFWAFQVAAPDYFPHKQIALGLGSGMGMGTEHVTWKSICDF